MNILANASVFIGLAIIFAGLISLGTTFNHCTKMPLQRSQALAYGSVTVILIGFAWLLVSVIFKLTTVPMQ